MLQSAASIPHGPLKFIANLDMTRNEKIISTICRVFVVLNLLPAIYVKILGATESILMFERLHADPSGRYITALLELLTVALILFPRSIWAGATLGFCIMLGAVIAHVFALGFHGGAGVAFVSAMLTGVCFGCLVYFYRKENLLLKEIGFN